MSILQEYERIKKDIGDEMWSSIDTYISLHPDLKFSDIIYNSQNWMNFEKWFHEEIKLRNINVEYFWETDYGDYRALIKLGKSDKIKGYAVVSYDEDSIRSLVGNRDEELSDEDLIESFKILASRDFDKYINLPNISDCSPLLQHIFKNQYECESQMVFLTDEDLEDLKFTEDDIKDLSNEIKKYGLDEIVEIYDKGYDYRIAGYGSLETQFFIDLTYRYKIETVNRLLPDRTCVEISSCSITNDVGGTTTIRNSNYKSEIDGITVTVEKPDGTIEQTVLESHDKLIDMPIKIEITDSFYDYETGYIYHGQIIENELLDSIREFGITGHKKDGIIYNPRKVSFSEFDIVKVLEMNYLNTKEKEGVSVR